MATYWFVSEEPDRLVPPETDTGTGAGLHHYQGHKDAADAIRSGYYDDGSPRTRLYIIEAEIKTHSVAERGWELHREPAGGE